MRALLLSIVVVVICALAVPAEAGSAVGTWTSDTGATFVIPESKTDFDLIVTRPNGKREVYKAHWVEGLVGTQFTYGDCTSTISGQDEDAIRTACAKTTSMWRRVAVQRGRIDGIVGTWHSTSGFHFAIPKFSRTSFDILMTAPDGTKTLMEGVWVAGKVGRQFTMGKYTCTFTEDDRDIIRVVAVDEKFVWQRDTN
jgi:hypothetical protein